MINKMTKNFIYLELIFALSAYFSHFYYKEFLVYVYSLKTISFIICFFIVEKKKSETIIISFVYLLISLMEIIQLFLIRIHIIGFKMSLHLEIVTQFCYLIFSLFKDSFRAKHKHIL